MIMPELRFLSSLLSVSSYPHSPSSECWDMDENETLFYEERNYYDMSVITGADAYHQTSYNDELFDTSQPSSSNCTASSKPFIFDTDPSGDSHQDWSRKHLRHWTSRDIANWIVFVAEQRHYMYEQIDLQSFDVDGLALCTMTETEFVAKAPSDFGKVLYDELQLLKQGYGTATQLPPFVRSFHHDGDTDRATTMTELNAHGSSLGDTGRIHCSDTDSGSAQVEATVPVKRLPGRPRGTRTKKKPEKRCGRLWEFIRDLLLNREYCPSLICWDDHSNGVFRFVHSEKVAGLWGTIKENPKMTYEKLSRAMRYYYKSKVLQPVLGRRLVYKFGPTATGWRTPNPNFRLPD